MSLDELYLPFQGIGQALYLIQTLGRPGKYGMRLPNWPENVAVIISQKKQLLWIDDLDGGEVELRGNELLSHKWQIWRIKND